MRRYKHCAGAAFVTVGMVLLVGQPTAASAGPLGVPANFPDISAPVALEGMKDAGTVLPPMPYEMYQLQEKISRAYEDNGDLGVFEVSPDRTSLIVRWHGEPPADLATLVEVEDAAAASFAVDLQSTDFSTGELLTEARRLVKEYGINGANVITAAAPNVDADGLTLYVDPSTAGRRVLEPIGLGIKTNFPIEVDLAEEATPATGNRYNESPPHFGGSAIARRNTTDGGVQLCSTAFRVSKPTGQTGMLTANHCGPASAEWENDHFTVGGLPTFSFGIEHVWSNQYDGAILDGSTYADSSTWAGAWNAATYTNLFGWVTTATVGTEVCYSGSRAGYVCGSIIQNPNMVYTFPGYIGSITGVYSTMSGTGALYPSPYGTGDSGGPGIQFYAYNGEFYPVASMIISGQSGANVRCPGRQESWHVCAENQLTTLAYKAATDMGWQLLGLAGTSA